MSMTQDMQEAEWNGQSRENNPFAEATTHGPLANRAQFERVQHDRLPTNRRYATPQG